MSYFHIRVFPRIGGKPPKSSIFCVDLQSDVSPRVGKNLSLEDGTPFRYTLKVYVNILMSQIFIDIFDLQSV